MGDTTTGDLGDTIRTVIEEARYTEQCRAIMSKLMWRIKKKLHDGSTVNVPYFGTVSANALTEGIDMTNPQTMTDTNVRVTPGEVGAQIVVTKKLIRDNQEDIIRAAGRILGDAMEVKRDTDGLGLLDNSTIALGGAGTTLALGHLAAAVATLAGNAVSTGGPAPRPYVTVHHPFTLLDLVDVMTPVLAAAGTSATTPGGVMDDMLRNYLRGQLFGMPIYEDGNLAIDASDAAKGGVFASGTGGALILATALEWEVDPEKDASKRAWELNVVGEWGVGNYLTGWSAELYNDALTPA